MRGVNFADHQRQPSRRRIHKKAHQRDDLFPDYGKVRLTTASEYEDALALHASHARMQQPEHHRSGRNDGPDVSSSLVSGAGYSGHVTARGKAEEEGEGRGGEGLFASSSRKGLPPGHLG